MDPLEVIRRAHAEAQASEAEVKTRSRLGCIKWIAILIIIGALIYLWKVNGG